ncbi:alpha/beta hydrolase [Nocardioides sp.]|uniref:alpha/beta hydrolase n=1 Tax=Nocardioides sp. TaxID=35761 RepID=UPI0025E7212E|nr:alpha/beta hydrolase [Nocardioides sp.]
MTGRRRLSSAAALVLTSALLAAACGSGSSDQEGAAAPPPDATVTYAPDLTADVYLPAQTGRAPMVVLVPGGSWQTADPTGLAGLAAGLADRGVVAATAHIRAAEDDVTYPVPVEDVLCAVSGVATDARTRGFRPTRVVVLGHSSGAHLAALAVLAFDDYDPDCSSPVVEPDGLIGMSGPYDISRRSDLALALLGSEPDEDEATWQAANPVERASLRPDVPVLLMHGEDDELVPVEFTTQFADALEAAGHPTTVDLVPDVDHLGIFAADVAAEPIADWLGSS